MVIKERFSFVNYYTLWRLSLYLSSPGYDFVIMRSAKSALAFGNHNILTIYYNMIQYITERRYCMIKAEIKPQLKTISVKLTVIEINFLEHLIRKETMVDNLSDAIRFCIRKEIQQRNSSKLYTSN